MKNTQKFVLGSVLLTTSWNCLAQESLYVTCSNEEIFCCEKNGKESYVVLPQDIWGEYNIANAKAFCEQNFQASVMSHDIETNEKEFSVLNDQQPVEYSDFP